MQNFEYIISPIRRKFVVYLSSIQEGDILTHSNGWYLLEIDISFPKSRRPCLTLNIANYNP